MKLNKKKAGIGAGIVAAAVLAFAPAAFATNTVRVDGTTTPAGNVAITGNNTGLGNIGFLTNFGVPATCTGSSITGYVKRGASATAGTQIGAISNMTFSPCTATTLNYPVAITKKASPAEWPIIIRTTPASKTQNVIDITIVGVSAQMRSTGSAPYLCNLNATGNVNGTFNRTTQRITIATAPAYPLNIIAYDTSGNKTPVGGLPPGTGTCVGQIETGDTAQMSGTFSVVTPGVGGIQLQ